MDYDYDFLDFTVKLYTISGEVHGDISCDDDGTAGYFYLSGCFYDHVIDKGIYYRMELYMNGQLQQTHLITVDEDYFNFIQDMSRQYSGLPITSPACSFHNMRFREMTQLEKLVSGFLKS